MTKSAPRFTGWRLLLGLFLIVCGAKLILIYRFGNPVPYWDQWNGEGSLIRSYLEGTLSISQFFSAHNEHRILWSRLLFMVLFMGNKQWDPILEMVVQTPLHALAIVTSVALLGRNLGRWGVAALSVFAGILAATPFGWENTLWGFQSGFYFMMLFGILVIWICWREEALTRRWWLGALLAFLTLFTMAGGVFFLVAATALMAARLASEGRTHRRGRLIGVVFFSGLILFGVAITPVSRNPEGVAQNAGAFISALTGILAWPCQPHWACAVIQAPLILLAIICLFRRVPVSDGRCLVVFIGAAFYIQALITAYRRCDGWAASRYTDSWAILLLAGAASLCLLRGMRGGRFVVPLAAIWLGLVMYGVVDAALNQLPRQLAEHRRMQLEMEYNVREFIVTGDASYLAARLPYPNWKVLEQILSSEKILDSLPPALGPNDPLVPSASRESGAGFTGNGCPAGLPPLDVPVLGSYTGRGAVSQGGVQLDFAIPPGTRQLEMEVAGYPGARGMELKIKQGHAPSWSIAPPLDPGSQWQSLPIYLDGKSPGFKLFARDRSDSAWLAFSLPSITAAHRPAHWARWLAARGEWFIVLGLVLMILDYGLAASDFR